MTWDVTMFTLYFQYKMPLWFEGPVSFKYQITPDSIRSMTVYF